MPAPRFHPFARLLIAVVGAVAMTFVVVLAIVTATAFAAMLGGQDVEKQITIFFQKNLLVANLFVYPPIFLWLWFCRRFFDRRAFVSLGLRAKGFFGQFSGGLVCGFLTCAFTFGVLWLSGNVQFKGLSLAAQSGGWNHAILALLGWALMMLCVGFMEEIIFRGYAFHNLNIWLGTRWAIAIQTAVFALVHLSNLAATGQSTPDAVLAAWLAMPNIFLIGVFFALCYLKTGSLWFPIAFHASWNFFLGCVFSLPVSGLPIFQLFEVRVSGSTPLTGGAFGPEASLLLTPILLALIFAVSRASDHRQAISDLQSLQQSTPAGELGEPIIDNQQIEINEERESRFRTRMGARQTEIDDQTRQTLRVLNESRRPLAAPEVSTPLPIPTLAAPEKPPVEVKPVETEPNKIEPLAPVEIIPTPPQEIEEPAPAPVAPQPSPQPTDKPKPPAPRW